jgi:hypothetical protein
MRRPLYFSTIHIPSDLSQAKEGATTHSSLVPITPALTDEQKLTDEQNAYILQVSHGKVTSDYSHASCSEDESESSFSATSASAYNTSRLLSMVQSIRVDMPESRHVGPARAT